ncbi:MAG: response regulator [Alphaproteobacteria bacterium]
MDGPRGADGARGGPLEGHRILVVDDSQAACAILRTILERAGATVETLGDGGAAVALLRRDPAAFDALLVDLVMEGVDGFAAIGQVAELRRGSRPAIVAMSATVEPAIVARCTALGAHERLLRKPYRATEVVACMAEALEGTAPAIEPAPAPTPRIVANDASGGTDPDAALAR